jgi:hypothetical protein
MTVYNYSHAMRGISQTTREQTLIHNYNKVGHKYFRRQYNNDMAGFLPYHTIRVKNTITSKLLNKYTKMELTDSPASWSPSPNAKETHKNPHFHWSLHGGGFSTIHTVTTIDDDLSLTSYNSSLTVTLTLPSTMVINLNLQLAIPSLPKPMRGGGFSTVHTVTTIDDDLSLTSHNSSLTVTSTLPSTRVINLNLPLAIPSLPKPTKHFTPSCRLIYFCLEHPLDVTISQEHMDILCIPSSQPAQAIVASCNTTTTMQFNSAELCNLLMHGRCTNGETLSLYLSCLCHANPTVTYVQLPLVTYSELMAGHKHKPFLP